MTAEASVPKWPFWGQIGNARKKSEEIKLNRATMEDSVSSNISDSVDNKEIDSKKERPTSLGLESTNVRNDEVHGRQKSEPKDQGLWI